MKEYLKKISFLSICVIFLFMITGCNQSDDKEDDLKSLEDDVTNQINDDFKYDEAKVNEAMDYIHKNIDDIKDSETAKKIYEKAAYVESVVKQSDSDIDNTITQYASKAKEYAHDVYTANEDDIDNIIKEGKKDIDNLKNDFETNKDKLVEEFSNFFK